MCDNRPDDWYKAVAVDEAIRDLSQLGIRDECFVSRTLYPLAVLEMVDFDIGDDKTREFRCNSGMCFT